MIRIKRANDELKADRPTKEENQFIEKCPIYIMLENIRSVHNVGSIFRAGDGFGVSEILLVGYTPCPPRKDLSKTALGADEVVPWAHYENAIDALNYLNEKKISLIAVEQTITSLSLYDIDFNYPVCFIFGNEVTGISEDVLSRVNVHTEIGMKGIKQSLNVAVSAGVVGYEALRRYQNLKTDVVRK